MSELTDLAKFVNQRNMIIAEIEMPYEGIT